MRSLLRAALLLIVLPALLLAAPAPLPRERKSKEAGGWSKPVDGLRVRLVAPQTRYRAGDTVRLVLEIQNVSGSSKTIEDPELYPSVSNREVSGWAITAVGHGRRGRLVKENEQLLKRLRAWRELGPEKTLRIEIDASGEAMEALSGEREAEDDKPRRQSLYFRDGETPGYYEFRAKFSRDASGDQVDLKGGWNGDSLLSPSVWIELHE